MWRTKAKLISHPHIPLSHILKDVLRPGEKCLKEDYRIQLCMNHIYIIKTNDTPNATPEWLVDQPLRRISKHIRVHNWKNLRHFQLQVNDYISLTDKHLKLLSLVIRQAFPKAQEISLMLPKYMDPKKGVPKLIYDIFRHAPDLKAFTLYLSSLTKEETIIQLGKNIGGNVSRLEILKLGLVQSYAHSLRYGNLQVLDLSTRIKNRNGGSIPNQLPKIKEGTKALSLEVASKLNKLKSLTYIITNSDGGVSDETVNQIMYNTGKRLPNLEQLSLAFSAFNKDQYTHIGIKSIFTNISQYFKNLRSLSLDFSDFPESKKVTDEMMEDLWVCIDSSLRGLSSLSLNFYGCKQLTSGGVNLSCWAVAEYLENLENLVLGFEDCPGFTPEAVQQLTSNHHIKHLKWLTFAFNGDTFDDLETGQAALQLISSFKTLKKFELRIPAHWGKMTDASVRAIGLGVTTFLKDLKVLSLIFPICHKLTSVGISQFTSDLALNHKKLKSLDLTIGGILELTDNTLVNLSDNISNNMVELEELTLNFMHAFSRGSPFTDEGIKHLAFSLCYGLSRLRSLTIMFMVPEGVTTQAILYLGSMIKNHAKQLKFLQLEFIFYNGSGLHPLIQQAKSSLLKDLWFIPTFHIVIS